MFIEIGNNTIMIIMTIFLFPIRNRGEVVTCRAIWRVKREDLFLAENLIASKRLQLDEKVSKVKGVQFFFSAVGGVTTTQPNNLKARKNFNKE